MTAKILSCVLSLLLCADCVAIQVSPESLAARGTIGSAQQSLKALRSGVWLSNPFLASDFRHTLPKGLIDLTEDGLVYCSVAREILIQIRCTRFGDVLVACNMAAQERSWGFVVGKVAGKGDRVYQNSLFRHPDGGVAGNVEVAGTILHELTHIYLETGLDSPKNWVHYYVEAVFLMRYRTHSMERALYATTVGYWAYVPTWRQYRPQDFKIAKETSMKLAQEPTAKVAKTNAAQWCSVAHLYC